VDELTRVCAHCDGRLAVSVQDTTRFCSKRCKSSWHRAHSASDKQCSVAECDRSVLARGLCRMHYQRDRLSGETGPAATVKVKRNSGLCARCGVAPRVPPSKCYCLACKRALERESAERRGTWKTPQSNCSRCGGERDGGHQSYCAKCWRIKNAERATQPCARCGKDRVETDKTNPVYCYNCWRNWWLLRKYGITGDQYEQMLIDQGNRCAICRTEPNGRTWHVDHDHAIETKRPRGILCDNCNRGLGHFGDDPARLRAAADYLEAHAS
jgi:hypothetical protein